MPTTDSRKTPQPFSEPSERSSKDHRRNLHEPNPTNHVFNGATRPSYKDSFPQDQATQNQIQEAEQMRQWVAKEDDFVLRQSKKKARIRVKEGRARSIDWLAVTLAATDKMQDHPEDEDDENEVDIIDPCSVIEGLNAVDLNALVTDIDTFLSLETRLSNRAYWNVRDSVQQNRFSLTISSL